MELFSLWRKVSNCYILIRSLQQVNQVRNQVKKKPPFFCWPKVHFVNIPQQANNSSHTLLFALKIPVWCSRERNGMKKEMLIFKQQKSWKLKLYSFKLIYDFWSLKVMSLKQKPSPFVLIIIYVELFMAQSKQEGKTKTKLFKTCPEIPQQEILHESSKPTGQNLHVVNSTGF